MAELPRSELLERDLERLIAQAAARPGVADLVNIAEMYRARLAELATGVTQQKAVVFSTTNSTG